MKKSIIVIICLNLCLLLGFPLSITVEANNHILKELADTTISISKEIDNDVEVTIYRDLDMFTDLVLRNYPEISHQQLADFIVNYTHQDILVVDSENADFILSLNNIHTTYEEFATGDNCDILPCSIRSRGSDTWTSGNGKLRIITSFSYIGSSDGADNYHIWSSAKWLTIPSTIIEDVFVLGTNAVFDSSYTEWGTLYIANHCNNSSCGNTNVIYRSVDATSTDFGNLHLQYTSGYPYLRFTDTGHICNSCLSTYTTRISFETYYAYNVLTSSPAMIYSSYGTLKLSLTSLNVNISYNGKPSISGSGTVGLSYDVYNARGVTLSH